MWEWRGVDVGGVRERHVWVDVGWEWDGEGRMKTFLTLYETIYIK